MAQLIEFSEKGLYVPRANIYIDPWKPVNKAIITHAHADHSRHGMKYYLAHEDSTNVMRLRLGDIHLSTLKYREAFVQNGVKFSLHPAGHIPGSAQVRVAYKGEVWVVGGDYNTERDVRICTPFEHVPCHTFITESTFALPVFKWQKPETVFEAIQKFHALNKANGKITFLFAYSLGKAQRIMDGLSGDTDVFYTHGAVHNVNEALRKQGLNLPPDIRITRDTKPADLSGKIVIAPPSAAAGTWIKRFKPRSTAFVSGWMRLRGTRRRRNVDSGFILSDHADWDGLNKAVQATGAERLFVTHGYTGVYAKYWHDQGLDAREVVTAYTGDEGSESENEDKV